MYVCFAVLAGGAGASTRAYVRAGFIPDVVGQATLFFFRWCPPVPERG